MFASKDIDFSGALKTNLILFSEHVQVGEDSFKFHEIKFQLITKQDSVRPIFEMLLRQFDRKKSEVWTYLQFIKNSDGRQFILFFNQLQQSFQKKYQNKLVNLECSVDLKQAELHFLEGKIKKMIILRSQD